MERLGSLQELETVRAFCWARLERWDALDTDAARPDAEPVVLLLAAFGQSSRKRHREEVALCNRALEAGVSIGLFITNMNKQLKKSNARMNLPAFFSSTR